MLNRVAQGGPGSAGGIQGVAQYPSQYSTWNPPGTPGSNALARNMSPSNPAYPQIGSLVDQIYAGQIPDPTGGSQNYYNPTQANPSWAGPLARRGSVPIGQHLFVGSGPTRISPALTVGGYGDMGAFGA
jgi:spore germination cell wall hydrolase CwlJ-like protein